MVDLPDLLTISEASRYLRVSRSTVTTLIRSGKLQAHKIGSRRWVIPRREISAYLNQTAIPFQISPSPNTAWYSGQRKNTNVRLAGRG